MKISYIGKGDDDVNLEILNLAWQMYNLLPSLLLLLYFCGNFLDATSLSLSCCSTVNYMIISFDPYYVIVNYDLL